MFTEWPLLALGIGAVLVGVLVAGLLVGRDLGPAARLGSAQRLLLAAALGSGVIAFTIKLSVIVLLSNAASGNRLHVPIVQGAIAAGESGETRAIDGRAIWESLPLEAPDSFDNPATPEKVALGRRLFADPLLSSDGTVSCASCHDLERKGGADGRSVSRGIKGAQGRRNAPSVYNAAFQARLFWDGRAKSLEEQSLGPLLNPIEMGNPDIASVAVRLAGSAEYIRDFSSAFGPGQMITGEHIAEAFAAYERTLITPDTPYDRLVRGDAAALSAAQLRGMALFESVGCINCHAGPNFSMASFLAPSRGRSAFRQFPSFASEFDPVMRLGDDRGIATSGGGIWRVPSLRNVALTAPYLHNGSVNELSDVVKYMAAGQLGRVITDNPKPPLVVTWSMADRRFTRTAPRVLSSLEVADIVAFLGALTSDRLANATNRAEELR